MELDKIVQGITAKRKKLERAWGNPSELSDIGLKLATYNSYLGEHLGDLKHQRETTRAKEYLDSLKDGKSATQAENEARAKVAEPTGQIARLELLHKDTARLISMLQSRLKVLEQQGKGNF